MKARQQDIEAGKDAPRPNGFDRPCATAFDAASGAARTHAEAERVAALLARATPPAGMEAAPVAPARGAVQLRENWRVVRGGTRSLEGVHLRDMIMPEVIVAQAFQRHQARCRATGEGAPFVAPFTPGQIAMARAYRDLVEWRAGSGMKCISIETGGGSGAGGSGLFIDSYIEQGRWLDTLRGRVGREVIMDIRRHMDRGNTRRPITAMVAVDSLVIEGMDLSAILVNHRWQVNGKNRKALRAGICRALDLMQGYGER